jgi:outer membrane protein OmpA-like peptidoglycan-associated protein
MSRYLLGLMMVCLLWTSTTLHGQPRCKELPIFPHFRGAMITDCPILNGAVDFSAPNGKTQHYDGVYTQYKYDFIKLKVTLQDLVQHYMGHLQDYKMQVMGSDDKVAILHGFLAGRHLWVKITLQPKEGYELLYAFDASVTGVKEASTTSTIDIDEEGKLTISINFEVGSAQLGAEDQLVVNQIAAWLLLHKGAVMQLQGHTDNSPEDNKSPQLSMLRAKAVYDALLKAHVPATSMEYKGFGSSKPANDNNTEDAKARNRRVAFIVKK